MGGQLGLPAETSQGRTEEIALLLPHVELGQHPSLNSSTCISACNRANAIAGWMGRDLARSCIPPQSL